MNVHGTGTTAQGRRATEAGRPDTDTDQTTTTTRVMAGLRSVGAWGRAFGRVDMSRTAVTEVLRMVTMSGHGKAANGIGRTTAAIGTRTRGTEAATGLVGDADGTATGAGSDHVGAASVGNTTVDGTGRRQTTSRSVSPSTLPSTLTLHTHTHTHTRSSSSTADQKEIERCEDKILFSPFALVKMDWFGGKSCRPRPTVASRRVICDWCLFFKGRVCIFF